MYVSVLALMTLIVDARADVQENRRQFILDQAMEEVMWDLGHKISLEEVRAIRDIFIRVRRPVHVGLAMPSL